MLYYDVKTVSRLKYKTTVISVARIKYIVSKMLDISMETCHIIIIITIKVFLSYSLHFFSSNNFLRSNFKLLIATLWKRIFTTD